MLDPALPARPDAGGRLLSALPSLSQEDVSTIWGLVAEFVQRQLYLNKGVQIPGFGTFTLMRQKLEIGNKLILIQRPMFVLTEKLVQKHGLKQNKVFIPGDIPVVPLNFVVLSLEGPYNRDTVEGCVKETLLFYHDPFPSNNMWSLCSKELGSLLSKMTK